MATFWATNAVVLSVVADTATCVSLPLIVKDKVPSDDGTSVIVILVLAILTDCIFLRKILYPLPLKLVGSYTLSFKETKEFPFSSGVEAAKSSSSGTIDCIILFL